MLNPIPINHRVCLLPTEAVRVIRGESAQSIFRAICDATHPKCLRWVFDVSAKPSRKRELRFWRDEVLTDSHPDKWATPATVIGKILGQRAHFKRGEIEIQWTISHVHIVELIRLGEIAELNHRLTRASMAAFLERRLQ